MVDNIAGIDSGSTTTAIVFWNKNEIIQRVETTGSEPVKKVIALLKGLSPQKFVHTGYHRDLLVEEFGGTTITEIRAFGIGASYLFPGCRTVIDLGGQDTKVINLSPEGKIERFELNDRCAAGTGRFLEVMAQALETDLENFIEEALKANHPTTINPMCTVFAESEVISLIARGISRPSISLGLHQAIATRIFNLLQRVKIISPIVFAGGGAKNRCLQKLLEEKLQEKILIPAQPQTLGALGAAIYGIRHNSEINDTLTDQLTGVGLDARPGLQIQAPGIAAPGSGFDSQPRLRSQNLQKEKICPLK